MNKKLITIIDKFSVFGGTLSGIMIFSSLILIVAEIITRTIFNNTLYVAEEYSGYLMCGLTFMALGITLREKGHIRMTFLQNIIKNPRHILVLDMICYVIGFIFSICITYFLVMFFWDSVISNSRSMRISETYLAIPQFFMPFGSFMLALQFLSEFLKNHMALKTGKIEVIEEDKSLGK
ncbi:MAG: TRAP transporter small permease [Candidatus Caldatribacteriota bacterium]|nr:TRAP transporter small permease [Candidatus Caldatribacteriota bacterium]